MRAKNAELKMKTCGVGKLQGNIGEMDREELLRLFDIAIQVRRMPTQVVQGAVNYDLVFADQGFPSEVDSNKKPPIRLTDRACRAALKSRTENASLQLNRGRTISRRKEQGRRDLTVSRFRVVLKSRTKLRRSIVRGLSANVHELSAVTLQLNRGKVLKRIATESAI